MNFPGREVEAAIAVIEIDEVLVAKMTFSPHISSSSLKILTFVSKSTRRPFKETIVRVFKGESFNGKEWKYYSADGEPVHVLARVYSLKSIDGKTKECVVENTDITDFALKMKELERETIEAKDKLKKMNDEYILLRKNIATYIRKKDPNVFDVESDTSEKKEDVKDFK